jgi:nucleoid DNA-binding protein
MNNAEFIRKLSQKTMLTQVEVKNLMSITMRLVKKLLDEDNKVSLPGLGTFKTTIRKKRKAYNPIYKKFLLLPPKRVVVFRPSAKIRDELKDKKV